jgi:UDP-N-acetylmuramyl pentapeptide synthase
MNGTRNLVSANARCLAVDLLNFLIKQIAFAYNVQHFQNKNVSLDNSGIHKLVSALAYQSAVRVEWPGIHQTANAIATTITGLIVDYYVRESQKIVKDAILMSH